MTTQTVIRASVFDANGQKPNRASGNSGM